LCVSVGGVTESTMKASSAALLKHVGALQTPAALLEFTTDLRDLVVEHVDTPRLTLPLMRSLQVLLEAGLLERLLDTSSSLMPSLTADLSEAIRPVFRTSKDVVVIMAALNLQVLLLPFATASLHSNSLRTLLLLLAHRYPKVRKSAADLIYVHFLTHGDPGVLILDCDVVAPETSMRPEHEGRLDMLMAILLETPWLDSLDHIARPARAKVLELLQLPPARVAKVATIETVNDILSYKELVDEVGY